MYAVLQEKPVRTQGAPRLQSGVAFMESVPLSLGDHFPKDSAPQAEPETDGEVRRRPSPRESLHTPLRPAGLRPTGLRQSSPFSPETFQAPAQLDSLFL